MKVERVILKGIKPDDFILATRAVRWLLGQVQKDAVLAYGIGKDQRHFYVCRNKASITVRPC